MGRAVALAGCLMLSVACGGGAPETRAFDPQSQIAVSIRPETATVAPGGTLAFIATVVGAADASVAWSLAEGQAAGAISADGVYTAPAAEGVFHVVATSHADQTKTAVAAVSVAKAPRIDVSINPPSAAIEPGATVKFSATVIGSSDTAVVWSADGGSVDATGLFTAPAGEGIFHVTAASHSDPSRSASATVTVRRAGVKVTVAVSPKTAQLQTGGRQQFTASVTGSTDARVTWSIAEGASGGTIDGTGAYTAPASPGTFHVVATSAADATATDSAVVTATKPACVPTTCSAQNASCGTIPDGCGGTLDCGACSTGSICGDPNAPHHAVTRCGIIDAPGCYTLAADLEASVLCMAIQNVSAVELDCAGHTISGTLGVQIQNAKTFQVRNCKLTNADNLGVSVVDSSDGTVESNDLRGGMQAVGSTRVTIASNTLGDTIFEEYGSGIVIRDNTIELPVSSKMTGGIIYAQFGSGTQVLRNRMNGNARWDGQTQAGADDGIILWDERDGVVDGNSISNVYDCGIETLGLTANTVMSNNTVQHAGICGIGGWFYVNWRGNRIVGNSADNTLQLFLFNRRGGLRPAGFDSQHRMPADTAIEFHDNVFERNSLTHPSGNVASSQIPLYASMLYTTSAYPFTVDGQRDPSDGEWNLMNNTFTGNQFGTSTPPPGFGNSEVRGAVVDGGGNVCATSQTTPYPLACGR